MASRRIFLQWASAAAVIQQGLVLPGLANPSGTASGPAPRLGDSRILIEFGPQMGTRIAGFDGGHAVWLTPAGTGEYLTLGDGRSIRDFRLQHQLTENITGKHGHGTRLTVTGLSGEGIEKTVEVSLVDRFPGFAFVQ